MKKFAIAAAVVIVAAFTAPAFAAMNPFMDVPASHWAYDAVAQLAARGVISGYPDGTYKGAKPTTRYEMASALARALAVVDMEKASKQDVEMLKRLVVEFKDELDALGVKVDGIDKRLAVMEKDLGGWSISGQFRFDARFSGENFESHFGDDNGTPKGKNDFELNRYRIWMKKRINETTTLTTRLGPASESHNPRIAGTGRRGVWWEQYYITTQLGYGITMHAGVKPIDWEGQLGFYTDNDAYIGDATRPMFHFLKDWGKANIEFVIARENDHLGLGKDFRTAKTDSAEMFMVAALANFDFTERFRAGLMAYYFWADSDERAYTDPGTGNIVDEDKADVLTLGVYAGYRFTPAVELKGLYYYQKLGDSFEINNEDKGNFWRIILDVKQEALKFTSLWIEYGQIDNTFIRWGGPQPSAEFGASHLANVDAAHNDDTSKFWGVIARQKWNDKWSTFLRYYQTKIGENAANVSVDDTKIWGLGIQYQLNPAVMFELGYEKADYGDVTGTGTPSGAYRTDDESVVRFRTFVTF